MGLDDVRDLGQVIGCVSSPLKCGEKRKEEVSKNAQNTLLNQ